MSDEHSKHRGGKNCRNRRTVGGEKFSRAPLRSSGNEIPSAPWPSTRSKGNERHREGLSWMDAKNLHGVRASLLVKVLGRLWNFQRPPGTASRARHLTPKTCSPARPARLLRRTPYQNPSRQRASLPRLRGQQAELPTAPLPPDPLLRTTHTPSPSHPPTNSQPHAAYPTTTWG